MGQITLTKATLNLARLYAELTADPGVHIVAIGATGDQITVYVEGELTEDARLIIIAVVESHDPDALTPDQQADAAGRTDLAGLLAEIATQRAALQAALDGWAGLGAAQKDALLRRLTAIQERELAVLAYLLRRWPLE
jgi:anti-sigma factor RsiW